MNQRFTLVEVLLAVALLSIGLVGVISGYAKAADALGIAQNSLEATALLAQRMAGIEEEFRQQGPLPRGRFANSFGEEFADYTWQIDVAPGPVDTLDEVALTITHTRTGRTYSAATLLPNEEAIAELSNDTR